MNMIRWRPMTDLDKWFDESILSSMMQGGFMPVVDVYQTKDAVIVETPLAGIDPSKVNVSIENDVLTIEGSVEHKTEVDEKEYYRKEIRSGSFHRAVALPTSVKGEAANALFEDGMLKITIPKEERAKPKTIKVNVNK